MCLPLPDIIKITHSHSGAGERSTGLAEIDVRIAQYRQVIYVLLIQKTMQQRDFLTCTRSS